MISLSDIRLLYLREIRMALRERYIVLNVILMPIFMYPILFWLMYTGMSFVIGQTEAFTSRIMIHQTNETGRALESRIISEERTEIITVANPIEAIKSDEIDLYVELRPDTNFEDNFLIAFTFDSSKDRSKLAKDRIENLINTYKTEYFEHIAIDLGLTNAAYQKVWIVHKNMASQNEMGRFILGMMVPMLLIVMVAIGGMYPALDATAGERERSTWETMLSVGTDRVNILISKYAYVVTMSTMAGLLNFFAITLSMRSILAPLLGDNIDDVSFSFPFIALPLIIIVTLLLALMVGAFMMIMATFAKTFKEAQSMVSPFITLMVLPGVFLQIPGIDFTMALATVPIVNVCLLFRETIAGIYHWPQIGITVLIQCLGVGLMLWLATAILKYEDVMVGNFEGSLGVFIKKRLLRRGVKKDKEQ